ncbi:MAG: hypothetical protein IH600_15730 [Bacteroidetes bacterium]|nr:hypothetical protein [Bacteroidota bacterium]
MNFPGLQNQNDFYSAHYLSDVFENDVKAQLTEWGRRAKEEKDFRAPFDAIASLRKGFFDLQGKLETVRSAADVLEMQSGFVAELLSALGYASQRDIQYAGDVAVPTIAALRRSSGAPLLWIIEAAGVNGDGGANPLDLELDEAQYPDVIPLDHRALGVTLEEVVSGMIFRMDDPPRWLLLVSADMLVLADRSKWNEKRLLGFDLREILDRRDAATLRAMAVLLHRDCIAPETSGASALLDTLDEQSHKHAYAVSEDLKFSMREAVELLGNEAVWYLREVAREKVYGGALPAEQLSAECLRYIYRLLFLFFIESRPELGYAPMNAEEYRTGYSLEALRDLELAPLESDEARGGYFLHHSIERLFTLVFEGFNVGAAQMHTEALHDTFSMPPLKSHLFDPARTPVLRRVRFRNAVLQQVIRLMSLSRTKRGRRPGRISYAQLGINQLGAVYEGLLSYTGFFAEEDMYEVKKKGTSPTPLERAYFVTRDELKEYDEEEKVLGEDDRVRSYPRGSFIYRLTGRSRETSASYYTPEVLTSCLVKYALKELLADKSSDDILQLKVCEPAMGSAAFLNEYVNQAAEAYLARKQKETGTAIAHDRYVEEKQKVKAWLADNCAYGVDLNPVAVELAEVSLWLNTMHRESIVPWFGNQLVCGNSLVGARRQYFPIAQLKKAKDTPLWLDAVPERVLPGTERPKDGVYHFLLPDRGMAAYADKVVKTMVPDELKAIKKWSGAFTNPPSKPEIDTLLRLSATIDGLWTEHVRQRKHIEEQTEDPIDIYGYPAFGGTRQRYTTQEKDALLRKELFGDGLRNAGPYQRLKLVMDYWCALWYWPMDRAALLPTRAEFLDDCALILEGKKQSALPGDPQTDMFPPSVPEQAKLELFERYGIVDVNELRGKHPRLSIVHEISEAQHFLHWELEFAEVFADRGGFDLVLGNPPWIKIEWNEGAVLGDADPKFLLRSISASDLAKEREETLKKYNLTGRYLSEFSASEATQNFLNARQNYTVLEGMKANLYKCFLPQAWMVLHDAGVSGFLHPEGVYDDPKGEKLRSEIYPRLRKHFQFANELMLFSDVDHHMKFSVNVTSNVANESFDHIANLFHPQTIDTCYDHDGVGEIPGIKDEDGNWNLSGHRRRVLRIGDDELELFSVLYDDRKTDRTTARLSTLHALELVDVLMKIADYPSKFANLKGRWYTTQHWNEVNAQKDGTIKRETRFPKKPVELIISGPNIYVDNPMYKTPRRICTQGSDYDVCDLVVIPETYQPRTNYVPRIGVEEYSNRIQKVTWGSEDVVSAYYRLIHRRMLNPAQERTTISAIIPPDVAHIHTMISTAFEKEIELLLLSAVMGSLILDFFVKTSGRNDLFLSNLSVAPIPQQPETRAILISRILRLNCLTKYYAELWERNWDHSYIGLECLRMRASLPYSKLGPKWKHENALRTEYDRRQAQLEIDVALAKELGITKEELNTIYRIQFPVLRQYEQDTWYDQNGRIVFTISKGLPGVGLDRKTWEEVRSMQSGTVVKTFEDDTMPGGPVTRTITYVAPWTRCDREEDYRSIWEKVKRVC